MLPKKMLSPKYWPLAVLLSLLWCFTRLPYAWQLRLAPSFGRGLYRISKKIRHVTRANIDACFSSLGESERQALYDKSVEELGFSLLETFIVWFRNVDRFLGGRYTVEGQEHLQAALDSGHGVIMLACHFGCVDVNGALLSRMDIGERLLVGTFRQTDAAVNDFLAKARGKYCDSMISAADQRAMVKILRKGNVIWYAPDIEVHNKSSAFVDFMGVKASTTLATSRLAKAGKAMVIPFAHYREDNKPSYRVKIFPPLDHFPSSDLEADTRKVNEAIEQVISPYPERYWWAIKRFKNRPPGESKVY